MTSSDLVKNRDRIGLFPQNMRLIDGGMELKYSQHRRECDMQNDLKRFENRKYQAIVFNLDM